MFKSPALKVFLANVTTAKEPLLGHKIKKHTCNFCGKRSGFNFLPHEVDKTNNYGFDSVLDSACCENMRNELEKCRQMHKKEYLEYSIQLIDELSTPQIYKRFRITNVKEKSVYGKIKEKFSGKKGFYFYSKDNGTGKTATSCIVCKTKCAYLGFKKYEFMNYTDFVSKYEQLPFEEKGDILEKYKTCNILLIDDLGKGRNTATAVSNIYNIVNYRVINELFTVFTSNLTPLEISETFDSSVASRLFEITEIIEMKGKDLRLN